MAKRLSDIINCIFGLMMLAVVGICAFCTRMDYAYKKEFMFPNWLYMMLGVLCVLAVSAGAHLLGKLLEKTHHTGAIMMLVSGLFFVGLVVLSYHYYFKTGWDAQTVEGTAHMIALGDWDAAQSKYFSYYPNNIFLTFIFSLVIRLGGMLGISNYYFCIIIFQCFLFAITGYFLYASAEILLNVRWALTVWILYVFLTGLSPWVVIPYSDATGILFPTLLLYLYLKIRRGKYVEIYILLMALLSYIGYKIKPQAAIVGIATFLFAVGTFRKEWLDNWGVILKRILGGGIGLVLGALIVTGGVKATHLEVDEELTCGIPHFLMLGFNEEYGGVINIVDQEFSFSFDNAEERNSENLRVLGERLKEQGLSGVLHLWTRKTLTNFADGTFAWWQEGGFYSEEMYDGIYGIRAALTDYYYEGGSRHEGFKNSVQTLWMGTLLLALLAVLNRKKVIGLEVLQLSVIGIIVFETLFEARARYLFIYAPVFILLACIGLFGVWQKVRSIKK